MADTTSTKTVLSLIATSSSKIRDLSIKNGQLIFIQDVGRIAFDFNNTRVFYNQIAELNTEVERQEIASPLNGYYFVIDTGVLWRYKNEWIQITGAPEEIVFIGVELPTLGQANKMYANITEGAENISVWSDELGAFIIVADKTQSMTSEEVIAMFNLKT